MKIERIDDSTVKCFLSNEELEGFKIDYKDFVTRTERAKLVVQEIIELAKEEVGYKPPQFAFDLQIMMVPDQGLMLVLSEKDPLGALSETESDMWKEVRDMLMNKIAEKERPEAGKSGDAAEESAEDGEVVPSRPEFAIFAFRSPGRVMEYAGILPRTLRVKSALYVMNDVYYVHIQKGSASYEKYSKACIQALEFGALFAAEQDRLEHLQEHGECLIAEQALKKLRMN